MVDHPDILQERDWRLSYHRRISADDFGRFVGAIVRFMGSSRFTFYITIFVAVRTMASVLLYQPSRAHAWDPYSLIFLNLVFSTQASCLAPLILPV